MRPAARVQVRPAREEDIAAVLDLWRVARSSRATTEDDPSALGRLLAEDSATLLVAHLGTSLVGTAIAAWDGWRGHIYRLAVLPDQRRQGIGRSLVNLSHVRLRELGATRVNAAVGENDPGPIAFWLAVGYQLDSGIDRYAKTL